MTKTTNQKLYMVLKDRGILAAARVLRRRCILTETNLRDELDHAGLPATTVVYLRAVPWNELQAAIEQLLDEASDNDPCLLETGALVGRVTAKITAIGEYSCCPDEDDAVDAVISLDGIDLGEVTLLHDHEGHLSSWGCAENWATSTLCEVLADVPELEPAIVAAVRAANTGSGQ